MKRIVILSFLHFFVLSFLSAQRVEQTLTSGWTFQRGDVAGAEAVGFDDSRWERVSVPHDWAIKGPFERKNDLQVVAVTQNGETEASEKTGRTGGLPYVGVGWYRTVFNVHPAPSEPALSSSTMSGQAGVEGSSSSLKKVFLVFDGAMSEARVYVNGKEAIFWPYGYNSFHCDITDLCDSAKQEQQLAVRLENIEQSSRWYSGAGLYRNVHVIETEAVHVPVWGTQVTTSILSDRSASITLNTNIEGAGEEEVTVYTEIISNQGKVVASKENKAFIRYGQPFRQNFTVAHPELWSPETPHLYKALTRIYCGGRLQDTYTTTFGIRTLEFVADRGFFLNGQPRKFQGVCLHHDLGPLGAAVNKSAIRHQLRILKDMGCDAIRTSHNMPAPELVELCNEMGFLMMLEPFDEWDIAKCRGGYHRYFNVVAEGETLTWAERDMINMLHHYRNDPAVVMWSVGNEVPTQCDEQGYKVAQFLRDICHREDPTRPVTCGMDQVSCVLDNGFAAQIDIPGFNYRAHRYEEAYSRLPQNIVLGSETSSTVSSRGVYKFPVELKSDAIYPDHQSSGYDVEYCSWSNIPDIDFANAEDHDWEIGQFVWTGFDYLGEPSPYDTDAWPSHSSLFGIVDLASIPKDRYWLYRSLWNRHDHTLHVLPHWTWPGREGQVTPVYVYTDAPAAELFVNGQSQGVQRKKSKTEAEDVRERYRLMWNDVVYQPGQIEVKGYYDDETITQTVRTAGRPHHIEVWGRDGEGLEPACDDLYYLTIRIVDKDGNLCPDADHLVNFKVSGNGSFVAAANGDAANLDLFHLPQHHAFHGQLTAIIRGGDLVSGKGSDNITLTATAKGLKSGSATVAVGGYHNPEFVKGADIGWSTEMASKGQHVCDAEGHPIEMTQLMKDYGCQAIRSRVWINPAQHDNWCNKADVLRKCLRANELGMDVMIDFHYSDWWCDPGKQPVPAAWSGKTVEEIKPLLRQHTLEVLQLLKDNGITPKWVQVGNETTYGFLWSVREDPKTGWPLPENDGKNVITEAIARIDRPGRNTHYYAPGVSAEGGAAAYAALFATGYDAVKEVFPEAQVIVHLDDGFDQELFDWNLSVLRDGGAKWDIIGMSLYTYWAINEGKRTDSDAIVSECMDNICHLYEKFGTPSMLVEVGMDSLNPDYGSRILRDILRNAQSNPYCLGAFYWEPACRPSQYRLGAFDETGRPTKIMETFRDN